MTKISLFIFTLLTTSVIVWAQTDPVAPQEFQYQAILRDSQGEPIANSDLTAQFTILEGSATGTTAYVETHTTATNAFGLINISIGAGSTSQNFSDINWTSGMFFIKTEVDLGTGMQDFGTKQLLSVPFALYGEDADADPSNEIQTLSLTGSILEISEGNTVDLGTLGADTDDQTLSLDGTELTISEGNTVDLVTLQDGTGTDSQELSLDGTELSISGGNSIDLASFGVDTDDQALSLLDDILTLEDGGTVDLSGYLDNTDTQLTEEQVDAFVDNNGYLTDESDDQALSLTDNTLALEDGGSVDLSSYLDNTDTQLTEAEVDDYVANNGYLTSESDDQALSLSDNTLSLEDGGSVDLSSYLDNTDTQLTESEVDDFVANNGYLTSETDDQAISLSGNTLTLEDGGTVDLSGYLDNTDTQLTESEVDDFVANNGYLTSETDDQAISLSGNTLTLEDGGTVDLSGYLDNTDTQLTESEVDDFVANNGYLTSETDDQAISLSGNTLTLEDGGTVDLSGYLDNTDEQNLSNVLSNGADAGAVAITNLADPTNDQDAATKAYIDGVVENINDYDESGNATLEVLGDPVVNVDVNNSFTYGATTGAYSQVAQSFTPGTTGIIDHVVMSLIFQSVSSHDIVIYEGTGYGGTEILRTNFTPSTTGAVEEEISVIGENVTLTSGETYTIAIESPTTMQGWLTSSNPYAGGITYQGTIQLLSWDFSVFQTYMTDGVGTPVTAVFANDKSVGIGVESPDESAALEIASSDQGLLIPRMTAAQRDAISSPATGLLVYNTDDNEINKYNGSAWLGEGSIPTITTTTASSIFVLVGTVYSLKPSSGTTLSSTIQLPGSPSAGDQFSIALSDRAATVTLSFDDALDASATIMGADEASTTASLTVSNPVMTLMFDGSTWVPLAGSFN